MKGRKSRREFEGDRGSSLKAVENHCNDRMQSIRSNLVATKNEDPRGSQRQR